MKLYNYDTLVNSIDKEMKNDLENCNIGGAIVSVFQEGSKEFRKCYGKANTDTGEKMTESTVFRMASMTKPVTAIAVLMQIEAGKIKLDDPISKYIPDFDGKYVGKMEDDKVIPDYLPNEAVKIYHLLTHTSGILSCDDIGFKQAAPLSVMSSLETVVDYYSKNIHLSATPGTEASYSPVAAFDIAARIVEITSDKKFYDFLKEKLFEPLEMIDTGFEPTKNQWDRMTAMHSKKDNKNSTNDMFGSVFENFPTSYHCGGAGLFSTIEDYSHFAQMLLNEGEYKGKRIISSNLIKIMRSEYIPETVKFIDKSQTWGLGVRVIKDYPDLPRGAFGWSGAYGTHFWIDPENKLYAIYLKNSYFDGGAGADTAFRFEKCVNKALNS